MDKICELLTFEKITFVCPICGRKKTVASPFIPDLYMICECGYKISTKAESEENDAKQ